MSRFNGSKGKIVRRFGLNLYGNPKFDRILSKRSSAPGVHGPKQGRKKISDYGQQLIEKQKLKYTYGVRERQFRVIFYRALKQKGITGDNLLISLERRLDNVLYRIGMASTRDAAKQLITHGHIKVNNRRVNIASFSVRVNDEITIKESSRSKALLQRNLEKTGEMQPSNWLIFDKELLKGKILRLPLRSEIPSIANEQFVVELYSK